MPKRQNLLVWCLSFRRHRVHFGTVGALVVAMVAWAGVLSPVGPEALGAEPPPANLLDRLGDQPATIVCLGDSVTGVYYHTGGRRAYPEMLELAIKKARPDRRVTVINAGISGHTTQNGLERLERDVLKHKPHLVTISFGLNDMTRIAPEAFRANLEELIARCRAIGSQVVLCTPNAVIDTGGRPTSKLISYCDIIREVGRAKEVPVCDQYEAGDALHKRDAWTWRLTLSDEIHPNMDGHKRMAIELCRTITGRTVSLDDEGPLVPTLPKTVALLKSRSPVRVLAMPPLDNWIVPALRAVHADAKLEVTPWTVAGKSLAEIEKEAQETVRARKPDLVLLAVPRSAAANTDEQFVKSYSWIMNWSLSFGLQEWDCVVVHPSVVSPGEVGPRDALVRQLVRAQDLHLIDRAADNVAPGESLFTRWISAANP